MSFAEAATRAPFDEAHRWLFDEALPVWSTAGLDGPGLGFVERLSRDGGPDPAPFKRMRVQARQIYVFSHAEFSGWAGGLAAAEAGYRFIRELGQVDGGGFARLLAPDGALLDGALDLYDQAFVLFALAWLHRAGGDGEPIRLAEATFAAVEARLARPDGRGYRSASDAGGEGLQNPHMHLLEAALALFEATGNGRWAEVAVGLGRLFSTTLYDLSTGTLAERFDGDWRRERPACVEPGHHFEWVWLLARLEALTGERFADEAAGLYAFARTHGVDAASGLALDAVSDRGAVLKGSHRLWAQTELLKAELARVETGPGDPAAVALAVGNLLDHYLKPAPAGCWRDQLDAGLGGTDVHVPASSLYHLHLAFAELERLRPLLEAKA